MRKNKVFLGGTCADSTWRDDLHIQVASFNPVVDDWTQDCIKIENDEKNNKCNIHLYVLTSESDGVYSIAECVQSSMTSGISTILHVLPGGFTSQRLKHLDAVCQLVRDNGAIAYIDDEIARTARVINFAFKTTDFT